MIVKMNKFAFLVLRQEYKGFLKKLQRKGVVHIQEKALDNNVDLLNSISEKMTFASSLRQELSLIIDNNDMPEAKNSDMSIDEIEDFCNRAKLKMDELSLIQAKKRNKEQDIEETLVWGDFDKTAIDRLKEYGYILDFGVISNKELQSLDTSNLIEICNLRGNVHLIWVHKDGDEKPSENLEIVKSPENGYVTLEKELQSIKLEEGKVLTELREYYVTIDSCIDEYLNELDNKYNFSRAILTGENILDDTIVYLEGWIPAKESSRVVSELEKESYFVKEIDITDEDKVPIKLKNNFFSRLFEPITAMFSMPNYQEIDQTALFAPFFMLFFGMCFGDGGYGLLLFSIATALRIFKKGWNTNIMKLLQWLGAGAFVIGLFIGTFFGVVLPYAKPEDYILNQNNLMALSVVIGIIQILFAKVIAAYKTKIQKGLKYSLAQFAWVIFLIGVITYYSIPFLLGDIPEVVSYIIYAVAGISLLIAFFYNTPGKNPFMNFGVGIWNTYNMASGLLGDTLSYIRLFAIGLTGGILGGVFNQLAIEQTAGLNIFARIPLALFILLVGHSINIGLAMIGSLVHPLRLTFVEFYKNSEFEGGGRKYSPFKEK